ncbi:LacI family DNA-binding transcriptional regulator [Aestuariibacter sp. A3R04]|uniref:LacI family DNA-binding transcriptional regulator n=1 Tax=Aestuariibacter sp. A3R04 TaxID=2841571 RepID=UPI001C0988CB|nr:LacI family DNA-binding transcriptional regulator [Aestuariibacter sp. A3R04]MBU3023771.1 LacI family DNA-binding transcriptional regulator [Aestuariibacter sp. A3R04]
MKKPTIKDVAKLAGVSFKTVSRVVNQEPNVSEEVKTKVQECITKLNYQPNHTARTMRKAPFSLAFVYDNPNSHYVIEMQNGIISECRKRGFELVIHPTDSRSEEVGRELAAMIGSNQIGGVILTPPLSENRELVTFLLNRDAKVVRILSGSGAPDDLAPVVHVNDVEAGRRMTGYLLDLGHKNVAFLGYHASHESSRGRLEGFVQAHSERGMKVDRNLVLDGEFTFDSGMAMTKQLLGLTNRPTAVFACNDEIAAGAVFMARLNQLQVPDDISIVGFENSPFSTQTWPHLTTIDQPNFDIAACAAAMVIDMMQTKEVKSVKSRGFDLKLLVRDSASAPPKP